MNDIITKIFQKSNHTQYETDGFSLFSLPDQSNFWVVIERENLLGLLDEQVSLFLKSKEIINNPRFDKNANLLVINKVDVLENLDKQLLLKIEEDLYHFKKSVIYYTDLEFEKLKAKLAEENLLQDLETKILDEKIFEKHKESFDNNDFESLLYRLAHKLPFVKINVKQVNNLESLEDLNSKSITDNELNDVLERELFLLSDERLANMKDDELLKKLKPVKSNENQQN